MSKKELTDIEKFHLPKIVTGAALHQNIDKLIKNEKDQTILVPSGIQNSHTLYLPLPARRSLVTSSSTGSNYIIHFGAGPNNGVNIWSKESNEHQLRKFKIKTDLRITNFVYIAPSYVIFCSCTDLTLRVFSGTFREHTRLQIQYSILSMIYDDVRNVVVTGAVGSVQQWHIDPSLRKPPSLKQEVTLHDKISDVKPWITYLHHAVHIKQVLALTGNCIFFLDAETLKELTVLENRHDFPLTVCLAYRRRQYLITGSKEGCIKIWNMSMGSFPYVATLHGHMKGITSLNIHPTESILISSSEDATIRMWRLETFRETYRFDLMEPALDVHLHSTEICFTFKQSVQISQINSFHSLFTLIGSKATMIKRIKTGQSPSRIIVEGEDGGLRIVSPVHGNILTMVFPIITHKVIQMVHDPIEEGVYALLDDGNVLAISSKSNPCRTVHLWKAKYADDRVNCLGQVYHKQRDTSTIVHLLLAIHNDGRLKLLRGTNVTMKTATPNRGVIKSIKSQENCTDQLVDFVTLDSEDFIMLWKLKYDKSDRLVPIMLQDLQLDSPPTQIALNQNITAVALGRRLVMYKFRQKCHGNMSITVHQHSRDEMHVENIMQVTCCQTLSIFASSSPDGRIKIWNENNQLIRELNFDNTLSGICFANDRGDLLVGFQGNLHYVSITKYLPVKYLRRILELTYTGDQIEFCLPFDPILRFWYDESWVETISLRKVNDYAIEPLKVCPGANPYDIGSTMADNDRMRLFGFLNSAKRDNASITPDEDCPLYLDADAHNYQKGRRGSLVAELPGIFGPNTFSGLLRHLAEHCDSPLSKESIISNEAGSGINSNEEKVSPIQQSQCAPDEKKVTSAKYWPCAPDGFIPNSTVRAIVAPPPPNFLTLLPTLRKWRPKKRDSEEEDLDFTFSDLDFSDEEEASDIYSNGRQLLSDSEEEVVIEEDYVPKVPSKKYEPAKPKPKPATKSKFESKIEESIKEIRKTPSVKEPLVEIVAPPKPDKPSKVIRFKDEPELKPKENVPKPYDRYYKMFWFPPNTGYNVTIVTKALIEKMKTAEPFILKDIMQCLADMHNVLTIPNHLMDQVISTLLGMLSSGKNKTFAIESLTKLDLNSKEVVIHLVGQLEDPSIDVRNAVKRALQSIAGITDTESLVESLRNFGVMQESFETTGGEVLDDIRLNFQNQSESFQNRMTKFFGNKKASHAKSATSTHHRSPQRRQRRKKKVRQETHENIKITKEESQLRIPGAQSPSQLVGTSSSLTPILDMAEAVSRLVVSPVDDDKKKKSDGGRTHPRNLLLHGNDLENNVELGSSEEMINDANQHIIQDRKNLSVESDDCIGLMPFAIEGGGVWHLNRSILKSADDSLEELLYNVAPKLYQKFNGTPSDDVVKKKIVINEISDLLTTTNIFSADPFPQHLTSANRYGYFNDKSDPSYINNIKSKTSFMSTGKQNKLKLPSVPQQDKEVTAPSALNYKDKLRELAEMKHGGTVKGRRDLLGIDSGSPIGDSDIEPFLSSIQSGDSFAQRESQCLGKLLLATAISALRAKRKNVEGLMNQGIVCNETLNGICSLLKIFQYHGQQIPLPPDELQEVITQIQSEVSNIAQYDSLLELVPKATTEMELVRAPIRRQPTMSNVRGERIANKLQFLPRLKSNASQDDEGLLVKSIPERHGAYTVLREKGRSNYGRLDIHWVTHPSEYPALKITSRKSIEVENSQHQIGMYQDAKEADNSQRLPRLFKKRLESRLKNNSPVTIPPTPIKISTTSYNALTHLAHWSKDTSFNKKAVVPPSFFDQKRKEPVPPCNSPKSRAK